jgi:hypothetical protein
VCDIVVVLPFYIKKYLKAKRRIMEILSRRNQNPSRYIITL